MAYNVNELTRLAHLKSLAERTKADYEKKIGAVAADVAKAFKSLKVEGNKVNLYTSADQTGEVAASFDFPAELFLDQTKTTFVPEFVFSAENYPGAADPNLEGKPVMVLAVKGADDAVTDSFLDMTKLVDTYTAKVGDGSATVTVDGYEISVNVNISEKEGNMLQKDENGKLFVPTPEAVDISGKADKVAGATEGNLPMLDAEGNLTNSNIAATNVVTADTIATDEEVEEMLAEVFPAE